MKPRQVLKDDQINAWLGEETRLEGGTLRFDGCLRIDGKVLDAALEGPALIIGEQARVTGRITVEQLTVFGEADVLARVARKAWVAPGGVFEGEMQLLEPALTVDEGGRFQGKVKSIPRGQPT